MYVPWLICRVLCRDGADSLTKYSFLCPNGTLFNQVYFICDWWFNVDCSQVQIARVKTTDRLHRMKPKKPVPRVESNHLLDWKDTPVDQHEFINLRNFVSVYEDDILSLNIKF